jgi:hypothetical protein
MNGFTLLMAAATGAPTFSIATTLHSQPAAVPTTPAKTKEGTARQWYAALGSPRRRY